MPFWDLYFTTDKIDLEQMTGIQTDLHFEDYDGDELSYSITSSNDSIATGRFNPENLQIYITPKDEGEVTFTVTASDGKGGTISGTFTVTVGPPIG